MTTMRRHEEVDAAPPAERGVGLARSEEEADDDAGRSSAAGSRASHAPGSRKNSLASMSGERAQLGSCLSSLG